MIKITYPIWRFRFSPSKQCALVSNHRLDISEDPQNQFISTNNIYYYWYIAIYSLGKIVFIADNMICYVPSNESCDPAAPMTPIHGIFPWATISPATMAFLYPAASRKVLLYL